MLNKVMLIGNVGKDPEVRSTSSGQDVATLSLATTEKWKDKSGQKQEKTEWHRVTAWGKLAGLVGQYVSKGSKLYVEGKLTTRKWEKDGQTHYSTEVVAQTIRFLSPASGAQKPAPEPEMPSPEDDDIPF